MDMFFGLFVLFILLPINYILLKMFRGVIESFAVVLISMMLNVLVICLYTYGWYDDVTSLMKFSIGLGLGVMLNMIIKIFLVQKQIMEKNLQQISDKL